MFFLKGIQQYGLITDQVSNWNSLQDSHFKQDRYFDENNEKSGKYYKYFIG